MTDDDFDEADFDDPAHASIRDLLASARVATPVPAEVAARLDATLAELTGQTSSPAPVPDEAYPVVLPLRRRARLAPRLLAAAAVVAVAGAGAVGLNQILGNHGSVHPTTADSATSAGTGSQAQPEKAPTDFDAKNGGILDGSSSATNEAVLGRIPALTTADFADQAGTLDLPSARLFSLAEVDKAPSGLSAAVPKPSSTRSEPGSSGSAPGSNAPQAPNRAPKNDLAAQTRALRYAALQARGCVGPKMDGTSQYAIVLDSRPAVLVVHAANAGTRLVEAWSCDGSKVLAFTTVPA